MQIVGRHYATGELVAVETKGDSVVGLAPARAAQGPGNPPWLAPGFVDLQINGYGGQEFSSADLTPEAVDRVVESQFAFGVTHLCPTVTTGSFETMAHAMRTIAEACALSPRTGRSVIGIHMEGPYISREDGPRGAHPLEHCRPPDWDEFLRLQESADGRICMVTLSPEYEEAPAFIRRAAASGVVVAIGHTGASSCEIAAAAEAGARLSTHLGNGAHGMLRRHPNYIWDQLAEDRIWASLIIDGHHLPPAVVKTFVRAKRPERCIIVSDLSGLAGLPPGVYGTNLCRLEILADGRLVIAGQDQLLAGASQPIGVGVRNAMLFAGADVDMETAVNMATVNPAALLGLALGKLAPGAGADLVLFDLNAVDSAGALEVRATVSGGQLVYGQL